MGCFPGSAFHHIAICHKRCQGAAALFLLRVWRPVFLLPQKQFAAGGSTHQHCQLCIAEAKVFPKACPCLQGQHPQAESDGEPGPMLCIGKSIDNAGIADGFAAAGGGHIDAEKSLFSAGLPQRESQLVGLVLPGKARNSGRFNQSIVLCQGRQVSGKRGQKAGKMGGAVGHTQQMLIQILFDQHLALMAAGVGNQFRG